MSVDSAPKIHWTLAPERSTYALDTSEVWVALRLRSVSAEMIRRGRLPMRVVFVIDTSMSMHGRPMEQVKRTLLTLVQEPEPGDEVAVVQFDADARLIAPFTPCDARAAEVLMQRLDRLVHHGGTHLEAGLRCALSLLERYDPEERRQRFALVLTDGEASRDERSVGGLEAIVREQRHGATVSLLGYGAHHDEEVLEALAHAGRGTYHFIHSAPRCLPQMRAALGIQQTMCGVNLRVELSLLPDVSVREVHGSYLHSSLTPDAQGISPREVSVWLDDMNAECEFDVALQLELHEPGGEEGPRELLTRTLRYEDTQTGALVLLEERPVITLSTAPCDPHPLAAEVLLLARVQRLRLSAREAVQEEMLANALSLLLEARQACGRHIEASETREPPRFAALRDQLDLEIEALRARDLAAHRDVVRAHTVPVTHFNPIRIHQESSGTLFAGGLALVFVAGPRRGARVESRGGRLLLGRSSGCDVVLREEEDQVSRQHGEIDWHEDRARYTDLGSTNGTLLNERPVPAHVPQWLKEGDVLRLGSHELLISRKT